jgi:uroporphyrinogen III methyltransferase / synthase
MNNFDQTKPAEPVSESNLPLRGTTVMVTRPRSQSEEIGSKLEALGASVIYFPTIEIVPPASWDAVDNALRKLSRYEWIIFTSANGARFFFERSTYLQIGIAAFAGQSVCAIGTATARAIEEFGVEVALTASESTAEGALAEFVAHIGGESKVQQLRILTPRARIAREVLSDGLRKLGATVDAVETYQTVKPNVPPEDLGRVFSDRSIDVITFTSPSTVSNFAELAGAKLSKLLSTTLVACIGPVTARAAESFGLARIIQPQVHNASALVEAIVSTLSRG